MGAYHMNLPRLEKISSDERGANYRVILPTDQELVLIFTKAGAKRGGHSHNTLEVNMVLTGRWRLYKMRKESALFPASEAVSEKGPGEAVVNLPGEPHWGECLEDSWLVDWKPGDKIGRSTTTEYPPYRSKVNDNPTFTSPIAEDR